LYSSPNLIRQTSKRMMVGHVAHIGEERKVYRVLAGEPEGKRPLGNQGVDGRMELEWILGILARGCRVNPVG
jgi:hypothetical protein